MKATTTIKQAFFTALKCGIGKAYLIAKNNPKVDFSNYIIKGALNNYAYDGQSESSRAQYIFELIQLSNQKEKIRKAVLNGLATEQEYTWNLTHLFELVKLYALEGDEVAKKVIYDRFLNHPIDGSDWVGYTEILSLDGWKGLLFIAEKYGKYILENPDDWQDDFIIRHFQENHPEMEVYQKLEKAAITNQFIKIYLDNIQETKNNRKQYVREKRVFKDVIEEVLNTSFLSLSRSKNLTVSELNEIGQRLLKEKDKSNIEKLLCVFTNHQFPFDSDFILKKAKQKTTPDNRIKEYAIDALKFLKRNNIREFALKRISKTRNPARFTDILIANYQDGDDKLLTSIVDKFKNEDIIEGLAESYSRIYSINKTKKCKIPLETLYYKINCGIHRKEILEILLENEVLSDEIKEEIKHDSYLEIRELL